MASAVINDKWYEERGKNLESDSRRITVAAAKLIRNQLRDTNYDMNSYPNSDALCDNEAARKWIPSLLMEFMDNLVSSDVKRVALCHAIVQAAKPKSALSPVLFAVGVSLDHAFGSKWGLDMLSRLGFSASYDEVYRYKQCVVQCDDTTDQPTSFPAAFTQWSGDNVDHNVNSLDGLGSLHGMGAISMTTTVDRLGDGTINTKAVPRSKRVNVPSLIKNKGIPILSYTATEETAMSSLLFTKTALLSLPPSTLSLSMDLVWHAGWFVSPVNCRPNWRGYMQDVTVPCGDFRSPANIRMLPIFDLNPNDLSCIYSLLHFVEQQAALLNMQRACITFVMVESR